MKQKQDRVSMPDVLVCGCLGAFITIGVVGFLGSTGFDNVFNLFIAAMLGSMVCALLLVLINTRQKKKED